MVFRQGRPPGSDDSSSSDGNDGPLARVTYLPGAEPPTKPEPAAAPAAPAATGQAEQYTTATAWAPSPMGADRSATATATAAAAAAWETGPTEAELLEAERVDAELAEQEAVNARTRKEVFTAARDAAEAKKARRAENVSMHALTRRGMSRWELHKTLTAREFDPDDIEAELDRLEGVGLIDDAALAETIVRTQHDRKGLGRSALTAELRRRHIDQQHIEKALEQIADDDEIARASELAERRAPQLRSYDRETAARRLSGFLMRKGYSGSVTRAAVDAALEQTHGGVRFR
ncbi:regulatory protein RecX [Marisediminicola senii]|uniref:regulatory protein RecX n=1 Tax=Marisediminicola senii TaxID=2711233 RepID=UPI001F180B62|nr:regulatory protein RecX [Marisediminicola senii]